MNTIWTAIVGTGSYIPERLVANSDFLGNEFYGPDGQKLERSTQETIDKFEAITDIKARRYVTDDLQASDIAFFAAKDALAAPQNHSAARFPPVTSRRTIRLLKG